MAMQIKPLEWTPASDGRGFIAVTAVGQFAVFDEGEPRWAFSGPFNSGYVYNKTDSFELAKNGAHEFYTNSVLSMIVQG